MKRILLLLVISIVVLTQTITQNLYWETSKGPYGGDFSLVKTPAGSLYAVETSGNWKETYRSTDQGQTWNQLTFLQDFFPGEKNKKVLITEAGGIYLNIPVQHATYKTTDDGQTWLTANGFDIELANGVLLKGENNAVKRSTNSGQTWTSVLDFPAGIIYGYSFTNTPYNGLLLECKRTINGDSISTLYRSFDEGATWAAQNIDPLFLNIFIAPTGTILCTKADTLFRSADGGMSFQSTGLYNNNMPSFTVLPSNRILMQHYYGILQYSDDDGISWDTLATPQEGSGGTFQPLRPLTDGTIFKNSRNALLRSVDGGLTWQFSGIGMRANTTQQIIFTTDSIYYAYTPIGVWKTNSAGQNWTQLNQNTSVGFYGGYFNITTTGGVAIHQDNHLFWSSDGGTFTDVTPPNGLDYYNYGANFSLNPQNGHFFINTAQGLESSTNFGQSWELFNDSLYFITRLGFHPSGRIIGYSWLSQLLVSDDNGVSWTPNPLPENPAVSAIRIAPDGDIYLLGVINDTEAYLWKSEDSGESWVKLPQQLDLTLWWLPIFEIAANGHLFTAVDRNISRSTNEGLTWQTVPYPVDSLFLNQYGSQTTCLAISPNQHLFAGTERYGLSKSINPISLGATIEGFVRVDADADCSTDDAQTPLKNRPIKAQGDDFTYFTTTDPTGRYTFFVDTGTYDVSLRNLHNFWWGECDSSQIVNLSAYNTTDTANFSAIALSDCPLMTVTVGVPALRRCFDNAVHVQYCNQGTVTADSAWVDVILDPFLSCVFASAPYINLGNNTLRFFVGDVVSGNCGDFLLYVNVDCDATVLGQTHCITAHAFPDTLCTTTPNWSGANINATVTCQDSIVHFQLQNTGPASSQILDYIIIEDDVVMLQGQQQYGPGQSLSLPLPANGHTLRIESEQEPGHPFSTQALAFEEGCGGFETLGFINQFSVNGITPSWHRVCRENIGSFDPNDKQGFPTGVGAEHRIRPGQPIEYMIRFQNTGTDTAFTVVVRDTLSQWLDPASIIPGAASHPYTWQLDGQGSIHFTFANILLPDSTTNLAGSQGFITFLIAQQPNVPLGTQILNEAAIFFDFNEPVITNETLHTVGVDLLSSAHDIPTLKKQDAVLVSPNPAGAFTAFRMAKGNFKGHHLQLFDPIGKAVFETKMTGNQVVLARNNYPAGAYGWRVSDARGQLVATGIVVFQ